MAEVRNYLLSNPTSLFQWHILLFPLPSSSLIFFMALVKWACSFSRFSSLLPPALSLSVSLLLAHAPPALLLGNPLYDLLLLTSCHMTSGWLRGKLWEVWLPTFLNPSPDTNQGTKQISGLRNETFLSWSCANKTNHTLKTGLLWWRRVKITH